MANLKEIRGRITSVASTQQITKAMKLVSATKLRKAQSAIIQMRPYAAKLKNILGNLSSSIDDPKLARYFEYREPKKVLVVLITSDRGLCGAFNSNVLKKANSVINGKFEKINKEDITILPLGKKGGEVFKKAGYTIDNRFVDIFQNLNSQAAFNIGNFLLEEFLAGKYDCIEVVYNQFKNAATQILTAEQFLPVSLEDFQESAGAGSNIDYIFEPGKVQILEDLVPRSLKTQIYRSLLDSFASEHGARMVAMEKATENAGELIKSLKLKYNQARQAAITNEISEIVGGAAALES